MKLQRSLEVWKMGMINYASALNLQKRLFSDREADKEVTSLRKETEMELPTDEVIHEQIVHCFAKSLCFCDIQWGHGVASSYTDETKLSENLFAREGIHARRLLRPLDSDSVNKLKNIHAATKKPAKAVNACSRKMPPSKSNPTQN